jgi:hypothetical protein
MNRMNVFSACACVLLAASSLDVHAQALEWGGLLQVDAGLPAGRDFTFPSGSYSPLGLSLDLHGEARPGENLRFYGEILASADGLPGLLAGFADLSSYAALHPSEARLIEAYVDLYDVLLPRLDIRLGRQRIPWGPAERVGVVDLVDPNDLEDPWKYGERTASDAVKVTWRAAALEVEAVYLPSFRPALLPHDPSSLMPGPAVDLPTPLVLGAVTPTLVAPAATVAAQATLASRISLNLGGIDIAVSYSYCRQYLPAVTSITGNWGTPPAVDLVVSFEYPRQHVVGLDASGELWGIGLWAEAAAFFPDYTVVTDMRAVAGPGALTGTAAEPYVKAVVGLEYTFPGDLYANLQYAHGFFHESTPGGLNDYLLLGVQWAVPGGLVTVGPIGAALEVDDIERFAETWALVLNPEIALHLMDNAELVVGVRWITGTSATTFASQKEAGNAVYARAVFSF